MGAQNRYRAHDVVVDGVVGIVGKTSLKEKLMTTEKKVFSSVFFVQFWVEIGIFLAVLLLMQISPTVGQFCRRVRRTEVTNRSRGLFKRGADSVERKKDTLVGFVPFFPEFPSFFVAFFYPKRGEIGPF